MDVTCLKNSPPFHVLSNKMLFECHYVQGHLESLVVAMTSSVSLNNKRGERINEGMQLISNKIKKSVVLNHLNFAST